MESHNDYSSRERARLLGGSTPRNPADPLAAPMGYSGGEAPGSGGTHTPSVSDLGGGAGGRVSTPTAALTTLAGPYAPRYHLPPALPGSSLAFMNSFLSAGAVAHSSEARKAMVPDVQHFWSVSAEGFPHYLMTGGLYPPYPPLFPPPSAESAALSLLGAGPGANPSSSHHTSVHYQRLLEFQKEAYLVAANHHLYGVPGVPPRSLRPYLEQTPSPAHNNPPASAIKQEPKELSCAEKATRLAERRSLGVKLDVEHAHSGRDKEEEDGARGGGGEGVATTAVGTDGGRPEAERFPMHTPMSAAFGTSGIASSGRHEVSNQFDNIMEHKTLPLMSPSLSLPFSSPSPLSLSLSPCQGTTGYKRTSCSSAITSSSSFSLSTTGSGSTPGRGGEFDGGGGGGGRDHHGDGSGVSNTGGGSRCASNTANNSNTVANRQAATHSYQPHHQSHHHHNHHQFSHDHTVQHHQQQQQQHQNMSEQALRKNGAAAAATTTTTTTSSSSSSSSPLTSSLLLSSSLSSSPSLSTPGRSSLNTSLNVPSPSTSFTNTHAHNTPTTRRGVGNHSNSPNRRVSSKTNPRATPESPYSPSSTPSSSTKRSSKVSTSSTSVSIPSSDSPALLKDNSNASPTPSSCSSLPPPPLPPPPPSSSSLSSSLLSSSASSSIINIPSFRTSPVPLVTVQHDGILLSALASPSPDAAASASALSSASTLNTGATTIGYARDSDTAFLSSSSPSGGKPTYSAEKMTTLSPSGKQHHTHSQQHVTDACATTATIQNTTRLSPHHSHQQHQRQYHHHPHHQQQQQHLHNHHQQQQQQQQQQNRDSPLTLSRSTVDLNNPNIGCPSSRNDRNDRTVEKEEEEEEGKTVAVVDASESTRTRLELVKLAKIKRDRAIQETIERVASGISDDDDQDQVDDDNEEEEEEEEKDSKESRRRTTRRTKDRNYPDLPKMLRAAPSPASTPNTTNGKSGLSTVVTSSLSSPSSSRVMTSGIAYINTSTSSFRTVASLSGQTPMSSALVSSSPSGSVFPGSAPTTTKGTTATTTTTTTTTTTINNYNDSTPHSYPSPSASAALVTQHAPVSKTHHSRLQQHHHLHPHNQAHGPRKVHAQTYFPEVGVFKGPSLQLMNRGHLLVYQQQQQQHHHHHHNHDKQQQQPQQHQQQQQQHLLLLPQSPPLSLLPSSSSLSLCLSCDHTAERSAKPRSQRDRTGPSAVTVATNNTTTTTTTITSTTTSTTTNNNNSDSVAVDAVVKLREPAPSPCPPFSPRPLLSPSLLLSPNSTTSSGHHLTGSSLASPRAHPETPDVTSNRESANVDSFSLTSGQSALDMNGEDTDRSDDSDQDLTIDEQPDDENECDEVKIHQLTTAPPPGFDTNANNFNLITTTTGATREEDVRRYPDGLFELQLSRGFVITDPSQKRAPVSTAMCLENAPPAGARKGFVVNLDTHPATERISFEEEVMDCRPLKLSPNCARRDLSRLSDCDPQTSESFSSSSSRVTVTLDGGGGGGGGGGRGGEEEEVTEERVGSVERGGVIMAKGSGVATACIRTGITNCTQRVKVKASTWSPRLALDPCCLAVSASHSHRYATLKQPVHAHCDYQAKLFPSFQPMEAVTVSTISGALQTFSMVQMNSLSSRPIPDNSDSASLLSRNVCCSNKSFDSGGGVGSMGVGVEGQGELSPRKRCHSAPLPGGKLTLAPFSVRVPSPTMDQCDRDFGVGKCSGSIPVGIPVAEIKPHKVQPCKDETRSGSCGPSTDNRTPTTSITDLNLSDIRHLPTSHPTDGSSSLMLPECSSPVQPALLSPPSHILNPSLWLQQVSLPSSSTSISSPLLSAVSRNNNNSNNNNKNRSDDNNGSISNDGNNNNSLQTASHRSSTVSASTSSDVRYPIRAPAGFSFSHDPATGQIFLIPMAAESSTNLETPTNLDNASWTPKVQASGKTSGSRSRKDKQPPRIISTIGRDGSRRQSLAQHFVTATTTSTTITSTTNINTTMPTQSRSSLPIKSSSPQPPLPLPPPPAVGALPPPLSSSSSSSSSFSSTALPSSTPLLPHQLLLTAASILAKPATQSRGCSPILFDSSNTEELFISGYPSISASCKKPQTFSRAVQTCDLLLPPNFPLKKEEFHTTSKTTGIRQTQTAQLSQTPNLTQSQTSHSAVPPLNPLSVQCPDIDTAGALSIGPGRSTERREYNPFNDPQILQAADGLELLSALAEKRPKCSSYDDPKRIFPSPSDSFKSDTPSLATADDTLSPGEGELRSGQCTPRRDTRRDLSPKWSLPKKESSLSASQFGDFKAPPVSSLELVDPVEVRERLAEVQRRYKQKQRELAKLPNRKNDATDIKSCKRGPGRPPKKKVLGKKSEDDSSSSSSKVKDTPQHKKKRPAEELVDRVFRKLPPVMKPAKVSRSIHYVKSKTGPFFKRKPASSSSKRNRDVYSFDDKPWLGLKERKHKKKKSGEGKIPKGKDQKVVIASRETSSSSFKSEKIPDVGNLFTNLQGSTLEENMTERRGRSSKGKSSFRDGKDGSKPLSSTKADAHPMENSMPGGVNKFPPSSLSAISTAATVNPSFSITANVASSSTTTASPSSTGTTTVGDGCGSHFTSGSLFSSSVPTITFGSISTFRESKDNSASGNSFINGVGQYPNNTTTTESGNANCYGGNMNNIGLIASSGSHSNSNNKDNSQHECRSSSRLYGASPSIGVMTSTSLPSTSYSLAALSNSLLCTDDGSSDESGSGSKHKHDEDSDTDTSDTSPNKKRKPGRPRKISTDKSSGGTETIWAKKSASRNLLQIPEPGASAGIEDDGRCLLDPSSPMMKPLFLDEEWCRRRSERIFLSEPSPQPLPSPRAEPVWKLSNFMPKNIKTAAETATGKGCKNEKDVNVTPDPPSSSASSSLFSPIKDPDKSTKIDDQISQTSRSSSAEPPPTKKSKVKAGKDAVAKEKLKSSALVEKESVTPSPTPSMKKARRADEHAKMKQQKAKSLHDLTQKVKKKYSKSSTTKKPEEEKTSNKVTSQKRKGSDLESEPIVLETKDRPITPEPASAVIKQEDLREGLSVLYLIEGLFYKGIVKAIQPPDVYGVLTAGQRGNRPHILCLEEILRDAVMDVNPGSTRYLSEGTRVCAFWSQQFSCLYPGTVAKTSPNPHSTSSINVEFDDGDSGRIPIGHIRLLPSDFPIIEYEPDPLENLPKRRKVVSSEPTSSRKDTPPVDKKSKGSSTPATSSSSSTPTPSSSKGVKNKRKKKQTVEETKDNDDDKDESDDSEDVDSDDSDAEQRIWKWAGKGTKRPGLKGRAKKEFYKSIMRGKETISVGDAAVFVSTVRSNCPYIGRIESLWESWGGQKMVRVSWFYHPEETKGGNRLAESKNALFESPHGDENDVQTIAHKCEVLSHSAFKRRVNDLSRKGQSMGPHVFYLAGYYDPTCSLVKFEPGVL